ncbi:Multidrug export protein AcrF [Planctomycetes bacterium Poly30]|uniref:Multidrug export protein AcrF n=1 Tax=Saltatorellus ferox TaxID=2528018 RepID=A0A518EP94_9BACT|nr:Multidrug export protein AcrF [Planctomycetes bacterium Poly30]
MNLIRQAVAQPITVSVGILLALLAGLIATLRVPIQMTPEVESVVIAVTTFWEGASSQEIETDVIEPQEERLGNLSGLVQMTSVSSSNQGQIRLEFKTGTPIADARTEVDLKLAEVPGYPEGVLQPVVVDVDPESVDYIAWVGLSSTDPAFDPTTLKDFVDRRIVPRLERIPGIAEVGFLGAQERELLVIVDPLRLANRGVTYTELLSRLREENGNWSAGKLPEGKNDIRIRAVGRFQDPEDVLDVVLRDTEAGPVLVRDIATVSVGFKERTDWVRSRGQLMPFFNFQLESGANLLDTMTGIDAEIASLNAPNGLLDLEAQRLGIDGTLELVKSYDATAYVRQALGLVQSNIVIGGAIATLVLLLFLRSFRTVGIVAVSIPISIIVAIVVLVAMGRSVNIVSLAGMAFAVGMVVDNAIVVIENIFRHLEMGKGVREASIEGTEEVGGAVLASTLTTVVVFVPILLIEDAAGQLFRDIALAIVAAVGLSLIVSVLVIPSAAAALLKKPTQGEGGALGSSQEPSGLAGKISGLVRWLGAHPARRIGVIAGFTIVTIFGIRWLAPPLDYLPTGNRNISFGILFPPPAYNLDQLSEIGDRIEDRIRPFWEAADDQFQVEAVLRGGPDPGTDERHPIPVFTPGGMLEVTPPPIENYFLVGIGGQMFHGAIATDDTKAVDAASLLQWSTGDGVAPDVFAFALQLPLFRTGGTTGSAISIDLTARELEEIVPAAGALLGQLIGAFGPYAVQPDPANFSLPSPELRFVPDDERLREAGLSRRDLGLAVQAGGDGLIVPRQFEFGGELKDLKILSPASRGSDPVPALLASPLATPDGRVVTLGAVSSIERVTAPDRIKRVDRQRAISLELTPPAEIPLEQALTMVDGIISDLRAKGAISQDIEVRYTGSAGKLADIKKALAGDGSFIGTLSSSLFLALSIVYLLMVVLFQSFLYPVVILVSVPLATLGGFAGLAIVHAWSASDRYMPTQNLDVLTILGFVILAGVVVNNAILIVHQALHFVRRDGMEIPKGISEAVRSRVRPIAMSTLTSVGGMLPLVLMPGSGSELYRGLGAVVVGGLVVSTVFTLVLVPLLLSTAMRFSEKRK